MKSSQKNILSKVNPITIAERFLMMFATVFTMLNYNPAFAADLMTQELNSTATISATDVKAPVAESTNLMGVQTLALAPAISTLDTTPTGRVLYVSTSGSDTNVGTAASPYKTLQTAVNQLQAGDTLIIREGTYMQSLDLKASGTADARITIKGEGNVIIDGKSLYAYEPAIDTKGFDYINIQNLTVNNARDAVEVSPNSSFIVIDDIKTNNNHFAVKINGGDNVIVRNVVATNSRNAFRTEAANGVTPHDILFENIEARGSKDIYAGYETKYRNGDGFILEAGNKITVRNAISADHWDAGFDIKATNVTIENVNVYGNKNNFKVWGTGIVVKNAWVHNARYLAEDPISGEGNGLNNRGGEITFINSTFSDNDKFDLKLDNQVGASKTTVINSIIARRMTDGQIFQNLGGTLTENNNVWYWQGHSNLGFTPSSTSVVADPKFVDWTNKDMHLASDSPAINKGVNAQNNTTTDLDGQTRISNNQIDLGAYEYQQTTAPKPITFTGLAADQSVSGIIKVTPNVDSTMNVQSVTYNIDGGFLSRETISPYTAGGVNGIDTAKLTNGSHVLSGSLVTPFGPQAFTINFNVNNPIVDPVVEPPVVIPPAPADQTAFNEVNGQISMEGESFSGSTTINGQSWQSADSTGMSGSKVLTAGPEMGRLVSTNITTVSPRADFKFYASAPGTYYVWLKGFPLDGGSDSLHVGLNGQVSTTGNAMSGFLYDGAQASWSSKNMANVRVAVNATQAGEQTLNLWMREDGLRIDKVVLSRDINFVPTGSGPAESARVGTQVTDTVPPSFNAITAANVTSSGATINWTTNEASDSQVEYRVQGAATWSSTNVNSSLVLNHSAVISALNADTNYEYRVKSKDAAGNLATQSLISNFKTVPASPTPAPTADWIGIAEGQTVSGVVKFGPNTQALSVQKVLYYIDKTKSTSAYEAPFLWGGVNGFDTKALSNGSHTLTGGYTDANGVDHNFPAVTFTVKNSTIPSTSNPVPTSTFVGITNNATVSGVVKIAPNLALPANAGIRKIGYYLNNTKSTQTISSPFMWGGPNGFDTRTLANGIYTLAGKYVIGSVEHDFTFTFTVKN